MSRRSLAVAAVLVLAGASDAFAQNRYGYGTDRGQQQAQGPGGDGLAMRYRYWMATLDGDVESEDTGVTASELGLDSTLGMDDKEMVNDIALWLPNLPLLGKLHVEYWWADFKGTSVINSDVGFSGRTFTAGSTLNSDMHWKVWSFMWEYTAQGPQLGSLAGFPGTSGITGQFGVRYIVADTDISDGVNNASAEMNAWVFPVIGTHASMNFGTFLSLNLQISGMQLFGMSDLDGLHFDLQAWVAVHISSFHAGAGYRWFKLDVKDDSPKGTDELDLDLYVEGFFFEAGFRF